MKNLLNIFCGLVMILGVHQPSANADIKEGMTEVDNQSVYIHAEFLRGSDVALVVSSLNGHPAPAGSINVFGQTTWDLCGPPDAPNSVHQLGQDQVAAASPELFSRLNDILFSEMDLGRLCQAVNPSLSTPIFQFWNLPKMNCQIQPQGNSSTPVGAAPTPPPTPASQVPLVTNLSPEELRALQIDFERWWAGYTSPTSPCHVTWTPASGTSPGRWTCDIKQRCFSSGQGVVKNCTRGPVPLVGACSCAWQTLGLAPGSVITTPPGDVPCVCGGGGCVTSGTAVMVVTTSLNNQGLPPAAGGGTRRIVIQGNCVTTGTGIVVENCFCS